MWELLPEDFPVRDQVALAVLGAEAGHLVQLGDITGVLETVQAMEELVARLPAGTELHDQYRIVTAQNRVVAAFLRQDPNLDATIARYRAAFDSAAALGPDARAVHLDTLIAFMMERTQATADPAVLDECVAMVTDGMATVPADSVELWRLESTLGWVLTRRFKAADDRDDLERAIRLLRRCIRHPRDPDPTSLSSARTFLGEALGAHYLLTGEEASYQEAMTVRRTNAQDPEIMLVGRLSDAQEAGKLAAKAARWNDAADMFAEAIALSSQLAWRGLQRVDQQSALTLGAGTAGEAAATAARAGDPVRAVELLEHGRAVLLHQALDVRSDAARARAELPELAQRLDEIQANIARTRDWSRRHHLAREWEQAVAEVRSRPGLSRFLRAPEFPALRPLVGHTVAVVNSSEVGSDAFLVTHAGVRVVPLPALTSEEVERQAHQFQRALATCTRGSAASAHERASALETVDGVLAWLWRVAAEPILDALGHHGPPPAETAWPRVHWCPTGMLSFLPLHAAGTRGTAATGSSVLDRVVSSYTPSLRVLRFAADRRDPPADQRSLLVVAMPDTPGLPTLPGAQHEAAALAGIPGAELLTGDSAVHTAVTRALREHAWVHFACHAAQDLGDPSNGRLYLHDHQDRPFTVQEISELHLEHAQLAYLSACDTARGGPQLPDEALHLSAALQLAGYRHVVAALWSVSDTVAASVTSQVYDRLRPPQSSELETAQTATALHEAVRTLRTRYPADPSLWAGYVHFGP